MSPRVRAYLSLERAMLDLDEQGDPLADRGWEAVTPTAGLWVPSKEMLQGSVAG